MWWQWKGGGGLLEMEGGSGEITSNECPLFKKKEKNKKKQKERTKKRKKKERRSIRGRSGEKEGKKKE